MIKEWDYDSRRKSNNDIVEKSQLGQRYSNSDSSYDEEEILQMAHQIAKRES